MDADELTAWMAYDRIEPIGDVRNDLRTSAQTAALLNVHRRSGTPAIKPADLMPRWDDKYRPKPDWAKVAEQKLKAMKGAPVGKHK